MVNASTTVPQTTADAEEAAWGIVKGRSSKGLRFTDETPAGSGNYVDRPVGTSYTGTLVENVVAQQATNFETKQPKTYADGTPIMELVLTLNVPSDVDPTDEDDDGNRVTRLSAQGKRALQDECRRLGIERFGIGTIVTITFTGYKSNGQNKRPSKTFDIKLENVQPWTSKAQAQVEQVLGAQQPVQHSIPVQQPQIQQVQQPVQVAAPAQPAAGAVDMQALIAAAQAAQAAQQPPAAPAPAGLVITQENKNQVNLLLQNGFSRQAAVEAVAETVAPGNADFRTALDNEIPF